MQTLIKKSITKWLVFTVLGIIAFTLGYFWGQRQAQVQELKEQSRITTIEQFV
jgi:hypothetical protein